jgi:hypothetical protein
LLLPPLVLFVLVEDGEPDVAPVVSPLVEVLVDPLVPVDPLVLGEAVVDVSPLLLVLPLGWLMLPELSGLVLLGVWVVDPVAPPVVELEPELLGV